MALSNWDTLAVTEAGAADEITTSRGVSIQIYKNWLYLRDPQAWREGRGFIKPTVAEIRSGDLSYADLHVVATRGPQDGVYVVAVEGSFAWQKQILIGCGVYGWHPRAGHGMPVSDPEAWLGVSQESQAFLKGFAASVLEEWSATVPEGIWDAAGRLNQGDKFLAERLGLEAPRTAVGEADEPLFTQAIRPAIQEGDLP